MQGLLLAVVYYLVVTPVGLLSRLIRDPLRRRPDRKASTYWVFTAAQKVVTGGSPGSGAPRAAAG
jgi:hypothetical protein